MKKFSYLFIFLILSINLLLLTVFGQESTSDSGLVPVIDSETTEESQTSEEETTEKIIETEDQELGFEENLASIQHESVEISIPFTTIRKPNPSLALGQEEIVKKGVEGRKRVVYTYKVSLNDKTLIDTAEEIIQPAQEQIIEYGVEEITSETMGESSQESSLETESTLEDDEIDSMTSEKSDENKESDDNNLNRAKENQKSKSIKETKEKSKLPRTGENRLNIYFNLSLLLLGIYLLIVRKIKTFFL